MAPASLPVGFRFCPSDVELVVYFLRRKVMGKALCFEAIAELDVYKFAPWDLPKKSFLQSRDLEWYFFCPRNRKYPSEPRINRATEIGFWKTIGRDKSVFHKSQAVGMKKTLVFHVGRAPGETQTNWVMHEYRLVDKDLEDTDISLDAYVLCKVFEKSGTGPKNGGKYGAPFKEEDWEDDMVNKSLEFPPLGNHGSSSFISDDDQNAVMQKSTFVPGNICESLLGPIPFLNEPSNAVKENPCSSEDIDIESLFATLNDEDPTCNIGDDNCEKPVLKNPESNVEGPPEFDKCDHFSGLEVLSTMAELKTTDNFHLPNLENKCVMDETLLGGNVSYLELDDLEYPTTIKENPECPVEVPGEANCFEYIPYHHNTSPLLHPTGYNCVLDEYMELDDLEYPMTYPSSMGYNCVLDQYIELDDLEYPMTYPSSMGYNCVMDQDIELDDLEYPMTYPVEAKSCEPLFEDLYDKVEGLVNPTLPSEVDLSGASTPHSFPIESGAHEKQFSMVSKDNESEGTEICGHDEDVRQSPVALLGEEPERENTCT